MEGSRVERMTGYGPKLVCFRTGRPVWFPEGFQIGDRTVYVNGKRADLPFRDRTRAFKEEDRVTVAGGCLYVNGKPADHGRRVQKGLQRAQQAGKVLGRPVRGHRAPDVPRLRAAGRTWQEIADNWNYQGLRTIRGKRWTASGVRLLAQKRELESLAEKAGYTCSLRTRETT